MSYHKYHTDALILGSTPVGEGSKLISLFTRELGLLTVSARSIREERSKLRYGLQDFSHSEVGLVRGKEFWRVTSATLSENLFNALREQSEAARVLERVCSLLRRLLPGEEKHEDLFDAVLAGFLFIKTNPGPTAVSGGEIVMVLRILYLLGYLAPREEFAPSLFECRVWSASVITNALSFRALAIAEINHSLRESQL